MAGQTDEGMKGLFVSAVHGGRLGDLRWGMLPLGVWALLSLSLVAAVTVPRPMAGIGPEASGLSAPAAQQAKLLIASERDLDLTTLEGRAECVPCEVCLIGMLPRPGGNAEAATVK